MSRRHEAAVLVACALAACAPPPVAAPPDLAGDANAPDAKRRPECQVGGGRAFFNYDLAIDAPGLGFDLNGDGRPDNALAPLGAILNAQLDRARRGGSALTIFHMPDLHDPPLVEGERIAVSLTEGVESRWPTDYNRNVAGGGEFQLRRTQYDVSCRSTSEFDEAVVRGGVIHGRSAVLPFAGGAGQILFERSVGEITLAPDFSRGEARIGASWTACGLSTTLADDQPVIGVVVGLLGLQPDVDLDGDGLERVTVDKGRVSGCTDGDGASIPGPECACDPRVRDGFSVSFSARSVPVRIVGFAP